jgi:hypothetical protein
MNILSKSVVIAALLNIAAIPLAYTEELRPSADFSPQQVVAIVLDALRNNNQPAQDAGIELTFRFAAPSNRANTGPIERFKTMVKSPAYRDLINHSVYEMGKIRIFQDHALIPILVTAHDGHTAAYMFRLGKQTLQPYDGAWMTESVYPIELIPLEKDSGVSA